MEEMKQLLAEQSRTILSEMKSHVQAEVSAQLRPHAARVDQLHDDQELIKKQLSDITEILKPQVPEPSNLRCVSPMFTTTPSSPNLMNMHRKPNMTTNQSDIEAIKAAKLRLHFSPISGDDLDRHKCNPSENVTADELIRRALHEYLEVNMNIPVAIIKKIEIKEVAHGVEIDFDTVTVQFSSISSVNTIFKYVKNLAPDQKVSIAVPTVLETKYEEFKSWSFHMRNVEPKHKTVIKYMGNDLVMYAKRIDDPRWFLVHQPPTSALCQEAPQKRHREEEIRTFSAKKVKKVTSDCTTIPPPTEQLNSKPTSIPRPLFTPVPCHSKPLGPDNPTGTFWPDVTRSPSSRTHQQSGNYQAQTMNWFHQLSYQASWYLTINPITLLINVQVCTLVFLTLDSYVWAPFPPFIRYQL